MLVCTFAQLQNTRQMCVILNNIKKINGSGTLVPPKWTTMQELLFEVEAPPPPEWIRAKELFLTVDGFGEKVYTLREIEAKLKAEGFTDVPSASTLSRRSSAEGWENERALLIKHAIVQKADFSKADKHEALTSMNDLAAYVHKTGKINADALCVLENWLQSLKQKQVINEKEASVAAKVMDATSRIYEKLIDKLDAKDNAKATANEVLKVLRGEKMREIIDIEFD